jgi:hypothetical protein
MKRKKEAKWLREKRIISSKRRSKSGFLDIFPLLKF